MSENKKKKTTLKRSSKPKNNHRKRRVEEYSDVMRHEHSSDNSFKSFIPKPKQISFELQNYDEDVILVLRQHPITQLKSTLLLIFTFFLIPWLISFSGLFSALPMRFIVALYLFAIIAFVGSATRQFLLWFFNVYIITDERIIDVDFISMIYKNISAAKIENIEDVTTRSTSAMSSIFDYGTIYVQTAGEKTEFEFEGVPQPAKVARLLNELILEEEREKIEGRVN